MLANPPSDQFRYTFLMLGISIVIGLLLGMAIVFSTPGIVFLALSIVLSVKLVLKNPVWGILGFITLTSTLIATDANPGVFIGIGHIYLTDIILITLFSLIGWKLLTRLEIKFVRTPLDIPLLVFVVVALVSTFVAMIRGTATLSSMLGPAREVLQLLLFFAVTNLVKTDKQIKLLQGMIIAFAWVVSIVMVIQYFTGAALPFLPGSVEVLYTEGTRFYGVTRIIPPGHSIVFIAFVIACSTWFFDNKSSGGILLTITIILSGIGVLLTFKRILWGALVVIFLIMLLVSNRKEIQRILIRGFSAFAVMLVSLFFIMNYTGSTGPDLIIGSADRMFSLLREDTYDDPDSSLRWRDFENYYASRQIISHPFMGIGLSTLYRPFIPGRDWSGFDGRGWIHNGYLWLLLRTGGIGFLAMMGMMITVVIRGFKYWRAVPNKAFMLGSTLAIVGMLIGNWVEPLISAGYWTPLTAILLGLNELSILSISQSDA